MELVEKLAKSRLRFVLMLIFICGLGLLTIAFCAFELASLHQFDGIVDLLTDLLPIIFMVGIGSIILPLCYLVSLRRVGQNVLRDACREVADSVDD